MINEQTRADLESLLAEQDNGWCAYGEYNEVIGRREHLVETGVGGCLIEQMTRMLDSNGTTRYRIDMMTKALGFQTLSEMFTWNDNQRDPWVIRQRIREALTGELVMAR